MRRDLYTDYPRPILWLIPEGTVTVGGVAGDGGEEDDASSSFTAEVEPFYISKLPVTNEQFEAFDPGFLRSPIGPDDRDPATGVSWDEAVAYCDWYAEVSRKPMRLPTEMEWEHACRAGASGRFFFDDEDEADEYLWDADNSDGQMRRLDGKKANGHGLFGMLGGVWEWTGSLYQPYPPDLRKVSEAAAPQEDGEEAAELRRVARGGSFRTPRGEISCSSRRPLTPDTRLDDLGFRIVKSLR